MCDVFGCFPTRYMQDAVSSSCWGSSARFGATETFSTDRGAPFIDEELLRVLESVHLHWTSITSLEFECASGLCISPVRKSNDHASDPSANLLYQYRCYSDKATSFECVDKLGQFIGPIWIVH